MSEVTYGCKPVYGLIGSAEHRVAETAAGYIENIHENTALDELREDPDEKEEQP